MNIQPWFKFEVEVNLVCKYLGSTWTVSCMSATLFELLCTSEDMDTIEGRLSHIIQGLPSKLLPHHLMAAETPFPQNVLGFGEAYLGAFPWGRKRSKSCGGMTKTFVGTSLYGRDPRNDRGPNGRMRGIPCL